MKSVLISIQPKWCELIASGKKTGEVRKTRPKIDVPFKAYIYATKPRHFYKISKHLLIRDENLFLVNGEVKMCEGFGVEYEDPDYKHLNCKVIGEFICDCITGLKANNMVQAYYNNTKNTCLTDEEIKQYANNKKLYYWHISDLVIYDKPKHIVEFCKPCDRDPQCDCNYCIRYSGNKPILHAPQSWCYVEVKGAEQ